MALSDVDVQFLPEIPADEIKKVFDLIETVRLEIQEDGRKGFPLHRASVFGMSKPRTTQKITESAAAKKYPEVNQAILELGKKYCPIPFNTVNVNKNLISVKHKDSNNVGKSMLLSIGDYTGCNIVIENRVCDAHNKPIVFDGSKLEHWNTSDLNGKKYSLVFYTITDEKKPRDERDSHEREREPRERALKPITDERKLKCREYRQNNKEIERARHERYMSNPENVIKVIERKKANNVPTECAVCKKMVLKYNMPKHLMTHPQE